MAVAFKHHRWSETTDACLDCGIDRIGWETRSILAGKRTTCDPQPQGGVTRFDPRDHSKLRQGPRPAKQWWARMKATGEEFLVTTVGRTCHDIQTPDGVRTVQSSDVVLSQR